MTWTDEQLQLLNQSYEENLRNFFYMTKSKKEDLLNKLGVSSKTVLDWFRNKRKSENDKLEPKRPPKRKYQRMRRGKLISVEPVNK